MTDESTLSEFSDSITDGGEGDKTGTDAEAADAAESDEPTPDPTDADCDTSLSTYAWGEYTCERCGADTDCVWRDDGAFVCPDCKEW